MGILKNFFNKFRSKKKPTLNEMIEHINKEYHFNDFNDTLIDEIYSLLLNYGSIKIAKNDEQDFTLQINELSYSITEKGIQQIG